jgi:glycosyltransferase involved in cell wall biosynthesis
MKISVIITCHNYAKYLSRAIRSAINQSMDKKDYEIIVVDDASEDETQEVINTYSGFIRPVILQENKGLAEARNLGIKVALGRFVINLDADDYFDENILLIENAYLAYNQNFDAVSCDYYIVDEKERHVNRVSGENKPIAAGIMFRKDLLFHIGLYDKNFRAREEEDLRTRFLKKGYKIYNIPLPLYRYRKHGKNMTSNAELMDEYQKRLQEKHNNNKNSIE